MNYKELERYIRKLFDDYLNKYRLSVDDKNDVIQSSLLKIFVKETDGTLTGDIENNKNYIFIIVRNYVFQMMNSKKRIFYELNECMEYEFKEKEIYDLIDTEIKIDAINKKIERKSFNDNERLIWDYLCKGYRLVEIEKEIDMSLSAIRVCWMQMKKKIRGEVYSKPKYLLVYNSGKKLNFLTLKDLLRHTKLSPDTFYQYEKLGKTQYKNYSIYKL